MINNDLKTQIISLLQSSISKHLSYDEICHILELGKADKRQLKEILSYLLKSNTITKSKHGYAFPNKRAVKPSSPLSPRLIEGILDATPLSRNLSFAFVKTPDGDFYVDAEDTLDAYHGDSVLIEPYFKRGKADYCQIRKLVKRANEALAGDVQYRDGKCYFVCSNPKIHNWFDVMDPDPELDGMKVILSVTNWGNRQLSKQPVGRITEVLGKSGNPEVEVLAVIRQYQLPLEFPEAVVKELEQFAAFQDGDPSKVLEDSELKRRKDLRNLFTFTIDPASAKDFDDAISIINTSQGWQLYVHIADVAHYVKIGSHLFDEAVKRGNSYYFPKRVIPMLPELISNRLCSLRPEEDKLCMTVFTEFDRKGKITKQSMFESIIRSDFRLAYHEVDELFEGRECNFPEELRNALHQSRMLSKLMTARRMEAGYIFFDLPEIEYEYDEEGFIHQFNLAEETDSHKLIENFMLIANEFVAKKLISIAPNSLYRIHEDPDVRKLDKLATLVENYGLFLRRDLDLNKSLQELLYSMPSKDYHIVFDRMILRSLKKAKYSSEHIRHFGLAIEDYTHFTSPIRRLCDLVVHHLCKVHIIKSSGIKLSQEQIKHYAEVASEKEIVADESERDVQRVYNLTYMKNKIGQTYHGIVISISSSSLIIRLEEIPITGVYKLVSDRNGRWRFQDQEMRVLNDKTSYYYQLMDKVKVQIMQVSDDIYLELSQDKDAHQHIYQKVPMTRQSQKQRSNEKRKRINQIRTGRKK